MLSYNHIYHAGCPADVFKHTILSLILQHLNAKEKPYTVIDTHAGRGLYDLKDVLSQKTGEAALGIKRLAEYCAAHNVPKVMRPYMEAVRKYNSDGGVRYYPGSPAISLAMMRRLDSLVLCELHPAEAEELRRVMANLSCRTEDEGKSAAAIHHRDAYEGAVALTPPKTRGLIFIDPSYEDAWEYEKVCVTIKAVLHRWPNGIAALWYPVLEKRNAQRMAMLDTLAALLPNEKVLNIRLKAAGLLMKESGVLVLNAPYKLGEEAAEARDFIEKILS